jgi:hypothetical protein
MIDLLLLVIEVVTLGALVTLLRRPAPPPPPPCEFQLAPPCQYADPDLSTLRQDLARLEVTFHQWKTAQEEAAGASTPTAPPAPEVMRLQRLEGAKAGVRLLRERLLVRAQRSAQQADDRLKGQPT